MHGPWVVTLLFENQDNCAVYQSSTCSLNMFFVALTWLYAPQPTYLHSLQRDFENNIVLARWLPEPKGHLWGHTGFKFCVYPWFLCFICHPRILRSISHDEDLEKYWSLERRDDGCHSGTRLLSVSEKVDVISPRIFPVSRQIAEQILYPAQWAFWFDQQAPSWIG